MADIIRAGALTGYCQLVQMLGHDPITLLREAGVSERDLDDPDTYLPHSAVSAVFERSADRFGAADFGLRLAALQDINRLGALAFAIRNAQDLRNAIETGAKYIHYQATQASVAIEPCDDPNNVLVVLRAEHMGKRSAQMAEHSVAGFSRILSHLTNEAVKPRRVLLAHQPISPSSVYLEHFGTAPEFGRPHNAVALDRRDLATPLATADRPLQALVERYLQLHSPPSGLEASQRVQQALVQIMRAGHPAAIEDVCDMLHIHPRTLQRRLLSEGTTFERVRDGVRKQMAEIYLANEIVPIAHVAHLLGYANQSVLSRSCLRWFGKTPLAMRQYLNAMAS